MSFNILIVEDELMIAEMIKEMLSELDYQVLGVAKNYKEATASLESKRDVIDLIVLDINLNDHKNGIDIGSLIKEKYQIPFVYLTSYSDPQTIRAAASTEPAAYLLKPFTVGDLHATVEVIKARKAVSAKSIMIKENDLNVKLEVADISYVKSDNNYLEIFTSRKKHLTRNSLEKFLEDVEESNIIRVHRSFAINISKIQAVNGQYLMIDDQKIPISRKHKSELMDMLEQI
ncbi:LytR/AlgR family response regulator transcription factor [Marinoscillum pacificum]|uniref:LytR/AlgR family response regulator transcription factor n=1 Tax=Marinoscillum pacificum TaxID=392723 RepID=UPI0021572102|nr:response regulator [Marinoscillum pacificum]